MWEPEVKKTLVVDATGVGTAVMDVFQRERIPGTLVGLPAAVCRWSFDGFVPPSIYLNRSINMRSLPR